MNSPHFLIVGAGKLGAFHLQGLAKLENDAVIDVYDPLKSSLHRASTLFYEIEDSTRHQIRFLTDTRHLKDNYDLGINATTSGLRAGSVSETAHRAENWILEKVLTQNVEQMDQIEDDLSHGQKTWVNLMLRELNWFKKAQQKILPQGVATFETKGKNWSLACNAPHHLDLVGWLSGTQLLSLDLSSLSDQWMASKRNGHFEVLGSIKAKYENNVEAVFTSSASGGNRMSTVTTCSDIWTIDEIKASISSTKGDAFTGKFERQSSLTKELAETIISKKHPNLPSLSYAAQTHRIYISAMLQHWNKTTNRNEIVVPIT